MLASAAVVIFLAAGVTPVTLAVAAASSLVLGFTKLPPPLLVILALAAGLEIAAMGERGRRIAVLSLGTDGTDGPTDAAGAIVDGTSVSRMRSAGADPSDRLADNDAYAASPEIAPMQAPDGVGRGSDDLATRRDGVFAGREAGVEDRTDRLGDLPEPVGHV